VDGKIKLILQKYGITIWWRVEFSGTFVTTADIFINLLGVFVSFMLPLTLMRLYKLPS
jgi:hypothetical protein